MKKSLTLVLVIPCLLASCNTGKVNVSDLYVPTFDTDERINIGAWSWTVKNVNDTQLQGLQEAGLNLLVGTFNNNETANAGLIDRASKYDMGIILDKRPWEGDIPSYKDKDSFLGYCVSDEPTMSELDSLKTLKQQWDNSELKDKMFYVNLNPCYSSRLGTTYDNYIKSFTEEVGLDMVSSDYYAMYQNEAGGTEIRQDWLKDLDVTSYYAKKNNKPLWFTLLTTTHNASGVTYIDPDANDMAYQMYVAMAFGTTYFLHYTYAATGPDHLNPIVDSKGQWTDSYYDVKDSSEMIRAWEKVYMSFKWQGISGVFGDEEDNTGLLDYLNYDVPVDEFGVLNKAKTDEDVIIGHFSNDDNKGLMITNVTNPDDAKDASVTLSFNKKYKGIKIFEGEKEKVLALNGDKITVDVKSSKGLFIVPLEKKK